MPYAAMESSATMQRLLPLEVKQTLHLADAQKHGGASGCEASWQIIHSWLMQVRFSRVDLSTAQYLDVATGRIMPRPAHLGKSRSSSDRGDKKAA